MPAEVEAMAYNEERGVPWHGLGTPVDGLMTAEDAIVKAGLNWEVVAYPLSDEFGVIPDKVAQRRATDHAYLGTVGDGFATVQNAEAFTFANALVAENPGKALYDTAGSLRGGRTVFLSMDLTAVAPINVAGEAFRTFLLIANSHDGSKALHAAITPVRSVCMNTVNLALAEASTHIAIRHSGDPTAKIKAAQHALGVTIDYVRRFEEVAAAAMKAQVKDDRAEKILQRVFRMRDTTLGDPEGKRYEDHAATRAFDIYQTADDLAPFRGTGWGLVNAVAEYVDHERIYGKNRDDAPDLRMTALVWGAGQQAVSQTLALVVPKAAQAKVAARAAALRVPVPVKASANA